MRHGTTITLFFLIAMLFHFPARASDDDCFPVSEDLKAWMARLSRSQAQPSTPVCKDRMPTVARFYQRVGYRPAWIGPDGVLPQGRTLLRTIANASMVGLSYNDYVLPHPESALVADIHGPDRMQSADMAAYICWDVMLTDRILRYARHLYAGRVDPERIYQAWLARRRPITRDIAVELADSLKNDCVDAYVESLHPQSEAYQGLRDALRRYEAIRRSGGWLPIEPGPTLEIGDKGPRVAILKHRLKTTGDGFDDGPIEDDGFDHLTASAVKHFQRRLGLEEDGRVGKETLAELNIPVEQRISQLKLSMERWRWFPDSLGDRYLMVNIPAFELTIVESGQRIDRIRVIVGKKHRQTPIMSDRVTYIEFNPFWNIPQKIARNDILPKVKHDPSYLIRQAIRVFDTWDRHAQALDPTRIDWNQLSTRYFPYRLRQDPSHRNALGQIKFIFPNPHSIYIHDTPGKSMFNRQVRTFSSGCVRIEEPIGLAHHLLNDQGWNRNRLKAVIATEKRESVVLATPMPVHLVYFTAWVDEDQTLNFRRDVYGHDARLFQALHHSVPDLIADGKSPENKTQQAFFTTAHDVFGSTHTRTAPPRTHSSVDPVSGSPDASAGPRHPIES